jgi:hypothetical protein
LKIFDVLCGPNGGFEFIIETGNSALNFASQRFILFGEGSVRRFRIFVEDGQIVGLRGGRVNRIEGFIESILIQILRQRSL